MPTSRRGFLKLLGVTTGAALVAPDTLIHMQAPAVTPAVVPIKHSGLAQSIVGFPARELGCNFSAHAILAREYVSRPQFTPNTNPSEAFLKGALEIQKALGKAAQDAILSENVWHRPRSKVVTSVMMPIHARPLMDGPGFEVVADCAVKVYGGSGIRLDKTLSEEGFHYDPQWSPKHFDVYSRNGEYPIQFPSDLDMECMMMTAEAWNRRDQGLLRRIAHIPVVNV